MRIGILVFSKPRDVATGSTRLAEAAVERGHEAVILHEPFFTIHEGQNGAVEILYENQPLQKFDVVISRPNFVEVPSLHTVTVDALVHTGVHVINAHHSFPLTKNKLVQKLTFAKHGIPTPTWAIVRSPEFAAAAAEPLGYPLILKVPFGSWGKGVFYVENIETLLPLVDYLHIRDHNPVILERFIAEARHADLRVFVIGGKIVAAMQRIAKEGDVRANIHAGAEGSLVKLTDTEREVALRAAAAFGLEVAGVDVIRSKTGPLILEVNANPGFEGLSAVTGIDVAGEIIAYAETQV